MRKKPSLPPVAKKNDSQGGSSRGGKSKLTHCSVSLIVLVFSAEQLFLFNFSSNPEKGGGRAEMVYTKNAFPMENLPPQLKRLEPYVSELEHAASSVEEGGEASLLDPRERCNLRACGDFSHRLGSSLLRQATGPRQGGRWFERDLCRAGAVKGLTTVKQ